MGCCFARRYITGAVLPNLNPDAPDDEKWGNELRKVCVLFVNLGIKEQQLLAAARYDEAMKDVHEVLCDVQRSVYQYEGAINKFLMDDKGSTLIACFGLPPGAHEDNCERGVLAALKICETLYVRAKRAQRRARGVAHGCQPIKCSFVLAPLAVARGRPPTNVPLCSRRSRLHEPPPSLLFLCARIARGCTSPLPPNCSFVLASLAGTGRACPRRAASRTGRCSAASSARASGASTLCSATA
jgi:hypothetical protein